MGERRGSTKCIAAAVVSLAASRAIASPVLVSLSTTGEGLGYDGYAWTQTTADLNAAANAAGGSVATTGDLSNAAALTGYDGVWVDVRQTALSTTESTALSAYIATGRRVVLVGGNAAAFATWNGSILGLVGGTDGGTIPTATLSATAVVPLTIGASSVYAQAGDVAVGGTGTGTSLFDQRVATVWGPARNVLVLLDDNVPGDNDIGQADNAGFANNLAQWATGGLPDPTCLWESTTGGQWQTGGNWLAGAMPAVADTAVFNRSSTYTTTVATAVTARNLTVISDRLTLDFSTAAAGLTLGSTLTVGPSNGSTGTLALTHSAGGGVAGLSATSVVVGSHGSLSVGVGTSLTSSLSAVGPVTVAGQLNLTGTSRASSLAIAGTTGAWTGRVDLGTGELILDGGNLATVTNQLAEGYDGGGWDGTGVTSSAASDDASHITAVGVIQNVGPNGSALYTTFGGQAVTASDVLVRTTLYGDANLDGVVDEADYTRIDAGFIGHLTGWANGDFNYDGVVDGSDYTLMDNAYNDAKTMTAIATADVAPVPEPGSWAWLAVATAWADRRRRGGRRGAAFQRGSL